MRRILAIYLAAALCGGNFGHTETADCDERMAVASASLFDHSPEEQEIIAHARLVYSRIKEGTTIRQRLETQVPEYRTDMLKVESALAELQPEIQLMTDVLRQAYVDGREDTYSLTKERGGRWSNASDNHAFDRRLANFNLALTVGHLRDHLREWITQGPTQGQMLAASHLTSFLMSGTLGLMRLRKELRPDHDDEKPLTAPIVSAYLSKTPGDTPNLILWYLFFQFRQLAHPLRLRSLNYAQLNELARTGIDLPPQKILNGIDVDIKTRVAPIMFVREGLLPIGAFLELSWQNLQLVQAVPRTVHTDIDGFSYDPYDALDHDFFHHSRVKFDQEKIAFKVLSKYVAAIKRDHPAWMPLLKALIFQYRHEDGERLSILPQLLNGYLTTALPRSDEVERFFETDTFHEVLREVGGSQQMFDTQWNAFIGYLNGVR